MLPKRLNITIRRGVTFELELITQKKVFNYDPETNVGPTDLKRSYQENLEEYGFVYAYLDFATDYDSASLEVIKPWIKSGGQALPPLLTLTSAGGDIILGDKSIKIIISAADTKKIEFDEGTYELLLTTLAGKVDGLIYGDVVVTGDK